MNMLYFLVPLPGSKHRKDVPAEAHDSPVILVGENPTDSHSEKIRVFTSDFSCHCDRSPVTVTEAV